MWISAASTRPYLFFFFNDTATTEIYTLSLHDALPICRGRKRQYRILPTGRKELKRWVAEQEDRSEEHTSELQSPDHLVCRLLLEKKNGIRPKHITNCSRTCAHPRKCFARWTRAAQ